VRDVAAELVKRGQLWPGPPDGHAMMRLQSGRMPGHVDRIKKLVLEKGTKKYSNLAADRQGRF